MPFFEYVCILEKGVRPSNFNKSSSTFIFKVQLFGISIVFAVTQSRLSQFFTNMTKKLRKSKRSQIINVFDIYFQCSPFTIQNWAVETLLYQMFLRSCSFNSNNSVAVILCRRWPRGTMSYMVSTSIRSAQWPAVDASRLKKYLLAVLSQL